MGATRNVYQRGPPRPLTPGVLLIHESIVSWPKHGWQEQLRLST
jgi:hypothetical protein